MIADGRAYSWQFTVPNVDTTEGTIKRPKGKSKKLDEALDKLKNENGEGQVTISVNDGNIKIGDATVHPANDLNDVNAINEAPDYTEFSILLNQLKELESQYTIPGSETSGSTTGSTTTDGTTTVAEGDGPIDYYYYEDPDQRDENGDPVKIRTSPQDIGQELSEIISKWYVSLRNIGLVIMMIVLLYIGIRILLSSAASDKAKYKELLRDWLVGMILLFTMHYIMVFANLIVKNLTKVVSTSIQKSEYWVYMEDDPDGNLSSFLEENGYGEGSKIQAVYGTDQIELTDVATPGVEKTILWPTDLLGSLRLQTQFTGWGTKFIGMGICYIMLVVLTIFFVFTYTKRVIYMAFLTLMAPLVAVTYPIDKITDGKAQGFDKWLKEYIFNLLIQPMHLLLYYILITSAIELAQTNVLYSIIAIAFMMPAEKLLRNFFGFEKASTPPSLAMGATAAMAAGGLLKPHPKGGAPAGGSSSGESAEETSKPPRMDMPSAAALEVDTALANMVPRQASDSNQSATGTVVAAQGGVPNTGMPSPEEDFDERQQAIDELRQGDLTDNERDYLDQQQAELDAERMAREQRLEQERIEREQQLEQERIEREQQREQERADQENALKSRVLKRPNISRGENAKRFMAARGAMAKAQLGNFAKRLPGNAMRFAGRGLGAAAGAIGGLALGAAQGDFSKAASYMAAGGAVGSKIGASATNRTANFADKAIASKAPLKDSQAEYNKSYYSKANRDRFAQQDQYKQMMKDKKQAETMIRNNFSEKDANRILNGSADGKTPAAYDLLYSNGVQDTKDIMTIQKMIDNKNSSVNSYSDGIAVLKAKKDIGTDYRGTKAKEWKEKMAERLKSKGLTDEEAAMGAEDFLNTVREFDDTRDKLYDRNQ